MSFHNEFSSVINTQIPDILSHLIDTYGKVQEENIMQDEGILRVRVFNITEPLVVMYNEIDDLQQLATAARLPYSDN